MNFRYHLQNNEDGFALTTMMLFLPLVALLIFSFGFTSYLIQWKTLMRKTCLLGTLDIQKNLIQKEEELFKLNPAARILRAKVLQTQIALAAAIASENVPLAVQLAEELRLLRQQQENLDRLQKNLIRQAQLNLAVQTQQLRARLGQADGKLQQIWEFYMKAFTQIILAKQADVAVVADSPDAAPVYELTLDHPVRQGLVFKWQQNYRTADEAQRLLKSENAFAMTCGASAQKKGDQWTLQINADKF